MKYNDKVRIKEGFYEGQEGIVVEEERFLFWKFYIVGIGGGTGVKLREKSLELIN